MKKLCVISHLQHIREDALQKRKTYYQPSHHCGAIICYYIVRAKWENDIDNMHCFLGHSECLR